MAAARKKIDEDSDLSKERKKGDHGRGERVRNAYTSCMVVGIWLGASGIVLVVSLLGGFLMYHLIETADYPDMLKALSYIATAVGGYILAFLRQNGVPLE